MLQLGAMMRDVIKGGDGSSYESTLCQTLFVSVHKLERRFTPWFSIQAAA